MVPLPRPLDPARWEWPMAGREASLSALESELARSHGGKRLVLVGGEPGTGKTRLVAEFAAAAHADGAVVLHGRTSDGPDPPYRPFAEALGHLVAHASDDALAGVRELAGVVPEADRRLGWARAHHRGAVEADQLVLFGAITALLERASREAPLVLVLEDLHWADEGALLMLRHLMTGPSEIAGLVLGTFRSTELAGDGPLAHALAALDRERDVSRVELTALSRADTASLLRDLLGPGDTDGAAELASSLHREAAGNPLFFTELVRTLLDSGSLRREDGEWVLDGGLGTTGLPGSLVGVVRQRVATLGRRAVDTLDTAAVVGQEFDPEVVERALGQDPGETHAIWDGAQRAGLVVEADGGRLAFGHPLVRRALYGELGSRHRGRLHRRVAEVLEPRGHEGDAAELARHWVSAVPADLARAEQWAARAGRYALDRFDARAAAGWYGQALELRDRRGGDGGRGRCELLIGLGAAQRQVGDPGFRESLLAASRLANHLGDEGLLVDAALLSSRGFASASGQVDEERVAILDAALRVVGGADSRERALLLATLATELTFSGELERRIGLSDEAVAIARRLGDPGALAHVLTVRFIALWVPDTLGERLANATEAVGLSDELGDAWAQFHAVHWRFAGLVQAGAFGETPAAAKRLEELARRLGDPTTRWISSYDRGMLAIIAGRLDEAERLAQEAVESASGSGPVDPVPMFTSQLTAIRFEQGRLPELQPLLARVASENTGIPAFRAVLALSYVEGDLHQQARDLLAIDATNGFAEIPADPSWLAAHALYGHVAAELGDRPAAASLYERLCPFADQVVFAGVAAWGHVEHVLGRLATVLRRFDDADRHLARALDRTIRAGAPIWAARVRLDTARLLLARDAPGDRERAVEPLEEAITSAARAGAATVERRARSLREHQRAMDIAAAAGQSGQRLRVRESSIEAAAEKAPARVGEGQRPDGELVQQGDYWVMRLDAREVRLRDSKGVRYLARLLTEAGVELHAMDLERGGTAPQVASVAATGEADWIVRSAYSEDAGAVLDPEAKRHYRARIQELREDIDEAERFNDPERASRARDELEFLGRELAGAVGLGGRDRKAASQAERARVNVTRAVRNAVKRIREYDEELGGHLEAFVRTGTFCCYRPPPGHVVDWEVDGSSS